jgi:hypothetical protein
MSILLTNIATANFARPTGGNPVIGQVRWANTAPTDPGLQQGDGTGRWEIYLYNGTGGTLTQYGVYLVSDDGTANSPLVKSITSAASGTFREVAVAINATNSGSGDWFYALGVIPNALVNGTTPVAIGDPLKISVATSAVAFIKDSPGSGAEWSDNTFGTAMAAQAAASNVAIKIRLNRTAKIVG